MSSSSKTSPTKPLFNDPDHNVIKLKYEKSEEFFELVLSHVTRLLDLPGTQLEVLRGQCGSVLKESSNKPNPSSKKSWNPLKKKDSKSVGCVLLEESLSQIEQLTDFLANHLTKEGLFRKPGNAVRQSQLLTALSTGVCINFEKSQFQAHDAACVLKTILGQLSEPLLMPSRHFDAHIQISNMKRLDPQSKELIPDKGKRIEALQLLLLLLPTSNRKVLRGVLDLLYQTAKHQKENKMNAANLSAMFAPHLIWPRTVKASDIHESINGLNDHIAFMIRHSQKLFLSPSYIRDAAQMYFYVPEQDCMSPQVSSTLLVAPSSAVKRTASDRRRSSEKTQTETKVAISDLYDQVNNLPNSSKKKKIMKNFSKHEEVLKYQNKGRKRHRTLSGMFRKKSLQLNKTKQEDSYKHFQQPGDEVDLLLKAHSKVSKVFSKSDTLSLNAEASKSTNKFASQSSLPERITRSTQQSESVKSPKLSVISRQIWNLQHRKSDTPPFKSGQKFAVKTSSPLLAKKPTKTSSV